MCFDTRYMIIERIILLVQKPQSYKWWKIWKQQYVLSYTEFYFVIFILASIYMHMIIHFVFIWPWYYDGTSQWHNVLISYNIIGNWKCFANSASEKNVMTQANKKSEMLYAGCFFSGLKQVNFFCINIKFVLFKNMCVEISSFIFVKTKVGNQQRN